MVTSRDAPTLTKSPQAGRWGRSIWGNSWQSRGKELGARSPPPTRSPGRRQREGVAAAWRTPGTRTWWWGPGTALTAHPTQCPAGASQGKSHKAPASCTEMATPPHDPVLAGTQPRARLSCPLPARNAPQNRALPAPPEGSATQAGSRSGPKSRPVSPGSCRPSVCPSRGHGSHRQKAEGHGSPSPPRPALRGANRCPTRSELRGDPRRQPGCRGAGPCLLLPSRSGWRTHRRLRAGPPRPLVQGAEPPSGS